MSETRHIPITAIAPNPQQPRKFFEPAALNELAASIKEHGGVLVPLIVTPNGSPDSFILIDGERRWRAAGLVGLDKIEVIIRPKADDGHMLEQALITNFHRADLNPIEEGKAYQQMKDLLGISAEAVAKRVGRSSVRVYSALKLLRLEPEIQVLIGAYQLPKDERVVDALLTVQAGEIRVKLAQRLARPGVKIKTVQLACAQVVESLKNVRVKGRGRKQASNPHAMTDLAAARAHAAEPAYDTPIELSELREAASAMCAKCQIKVDVLMNKYQEPAWLLLANAADRTCEACGMSDVAGACDACPGAELLKRVIDSTALKAGGTHARSR